MLKLLMSRKKKYTVYAPNVILATGGYNFDEKMVKDLTGIDMVPVGAPGRTGDGIKMAMAVGCRRTIWAQ